MNILVYEAREDEREALRRQGETLGVELAVCEEVPTLENAALAAGHQGVSILGQGQITAALLDAWHALGVRYLSTRTVGHDHIDLGHAKSLGMRVCNAAYDPDGVADFTVMLMLMCAKRFTYVDRQFRGGNFLVRMDMEHTYELGGKTLGMIGCGRISQLAMKKCKYGFGMKVIGYDPYMTQEKIGDLCELKETAKEVWEQADFVSVHLPVVPSTEHSIGREQFSWMKPTASFINCARGALIKEDELVACLQDGTLFQAGLDVFEHEPIQESSRALFDLDNVIMTPHMAATTEQSVLNCCTSVANDIVAVCNGQEPQVKAQKPKF